MTRMTGPSLAAGLFTAAVGWVALAVAQPPSPPRKSEPPLPRPVLPGQPGSIAPVRPMAHPSNSAAPAIVQTSAQAPAPNDSDTSITLPTTTIVAGQPDMPAEKNPGARQEPAVSIEWIGPSSAKVAQPTDYVLVVRNSGQAAVQQVLVRVRLGGNVAVIGAEPQAATASDILSWDVGTLLPKQQRTMQLRVSAPARGEFAAQAWVTFTGETALRVQVREPKLTVRIAAPDKLMVGEVATFALTVNNPGDGVADKVRLHADLGDGLEHPHGRRVDFDVGNLNPGESRTLQLACLARAGGEQACQVTAEADAGLRADARAVTVISMPRLDVEARGPKLRYLDRKATYTYKVTNPSDAAATNVTLSEVVPAGFKVVTVENGGRHDAANRVVSWFLGEIGPGQSREVTMDIMCVGMGDVTQKIVAQAARGVRSECELTTRIEGLSAIQLEVSDLEDPVEVNGETTYEMRLINTGTTVESSVKLACALPLDKVQFISASGPSPHSLVGNEVIFEPLLRLAPKADAVYRVKVKCTGAGIALFKARISSGVLTEPVTKEEATRIYAD